MRRPRPEWGNPVSPYLSWSVIGLCLLLMTGGAWLMLTASLPDDDSGGALSPHRHHRRLPAPPGTQTVTYSVRGTAPRALVAYRGPSGAAISLPGPAPLPWTRTVFLRPGAMLSLSARPIGGGTVVCAFSVSGPPHPRSKQAARPNADGITVVSDRL